jgi:hypothetical protein
MKRDRKSITYETEDSALDIKGPSDTFPNTIYFPQTYWVSKVTEVTLAVQWSAQMFGIQSLGSISATTTMLKNKNNEKYLSVQCQALEDGNRANSQNVVCIKHNSDNWQWTAA